MAYTITHESDGSTITGNATAIAVLGGSSLSIALKGPLRGVLDVTMGKTLHTVTIADSGTRVAALAGIQTAFSAGLMVQF